MLVFRYFWNCQKPFIVSYQSFQIVLGFEKFTSLWLSFLHYEVFKVRGTFYLCLRCLLLRSAIYILPSLYYIVNIFLRFFVNIFALTLLPFRTFSYYYSKPHVLRQLDYLTTCWLCCQSLFLNIYYFLNILFYLSENVVCYLFELIYNNK